MFPFSENLFFWATLLAATCAACLLMRRYARKLEATAPAGSLRNPGQLRMSVASAMLGALPLVYALGVNGDQIFEILTVLCAQAICMLCLRFGGVPYSVRVWLYVPLVALSAWVGGSFGASLWAGSVAVEATDKWLVLVVASSIFAVAGVLSIYSFPRGYGERER